MHIMQSSLFEVQKRDSSTSTHKNLEMLKRSELQIFDSLFSLENSSSEYFNLLFIKSLEMHNSINIKNSHISDDCILIML